MPPPLLTLHKRVFYLFHQNAEGLGVCVPHTEINFSSASGTKQSAMLIVASMCAHETYRAHLSSTSLPSWETFCSHSTAIIVNHCAQVMRYEHSWQMSDGHVYIISSKMKETQTRVLSVCRSLFNDSELWISPFLSYSLSFFLSYLPSPLLFFLFLCLSQDNFITQRLLLHLRRLNGVLRCVFFRCLFWFCYHSYAWLHCLFHHFLCIMFPWCLWYNQYRPATKFWGVTSLRSTRGGYHIVGYGHILMTSHLLLLWDEKLYYVVHFGTWFFFLIFLLQSWVIFYNKALQLGGSCGLMVRELGL